MGERPERLGKRNASHNLAKICIKENQTEQINLTKKINKNVDKINDITELSELFKSAITDINFYVCYSCTRNCFVEGIVKIKDLTPKQVYDSYLLNLNKKIKFYETYNDEKYYFCHTCLGCRAVNQK